MKRLLCLALLLSVAFACAASAEMSVDGDGWFDGDYLGSLVLIENTGLCFRLPAGWTDRTINETEHGYETLEAGLTLYVSAIPEDQLHAFADYCNNDPTENSAAIILQQDRDWLFILDPNAQTAIGITWCEGFPGGMELCFAHVSTPEKLTLVRRIISSVQSIP